MTEDCPLRDSFTRPCWADMLWRLAKAMTNVSSPLRSAVKGRLRRRPIAAKALDSRVRGNDKSPVFLSSRRQVWTVAHIR